MANKINPEVDDLRPVNDFVQARFGKRINPATTWRWRLKGVNGVKLSMMRFSGVWCTTAAAFAEFIRAQTANCTPAPMNSDATTERSAATTEKLRKAGLLDDDRRRVRKVQSRTDGECQPAPMDDDAPTERSAATTKKFAAAGLL